MTYTYKTEEDIGALMRFLNQLDKDSYPYKLDPWFDRSNPDPEGFAMYAYDGDKIIATYAAQKLAYSVYSEAFRDWVTQNNGTNGVITIPDGNQWYSSCQWVHPDYRGQELGILMDRKKKDEIWKRGGTVNYANCRDGLKDYHIDRLGYEKYQHQASVPGGNVGGAGSSEDKEYYVVYEVSN